jgi:hypothetical protein
MLNPGGVMDKYWIPGWNYKENNIYYLFDPIHEYYHKAITLDQFKSMDFDIIISSVEIHEPLFLKLRNSFQPKAKLVSHVGNAGQISDYLHVIYTTTQKLKKNQNSVVIHQELDKELYKYKRPNMDSKNIYSVVSFLPYRDVFDQYKQLLSEANMKAYGGYCPDGGLFGAKGVSRKMQEANLGWHLKPLGGLGHSTCGWAYSGRFVITNMSQHRLRNNEVLQILEPGSTCHDIEAHNVQENCQMIKKFLRPEEQLKKGLALKQRFHAIVNYDEEEQAARKFFEKVFA